MVTEKMIEAECDHKGKKVVCPSSAGPCCEGCGEPWPYDETPAPAPSTDAEPVAEIVEANTPAAQLLYGFDVKFHEAIRGLPIGTKLYAGVHQQAPVETVNSKLLAALKLAKDHSELEDEILDIVDDAIKSAGTAPRQDAATEIDAKRYRYLRDNEVRVWSGVGGKGYTVDIGFEGNGDDLGAAIDEAMKLEGY